VGVATSPRTTAGVHHVISQTVEYALRAIVTLAQHHGQPCTSKRIAEITQVPNAYLSKLMQGLVRGGIVSSQRGLHGGFVLMRDPEELTVLEVVDQVEPLKRIHQCPLRIQSHGASLCPLHRKLDGAMESIETMFRETKVAELLAEEGRSTPLCDGVAGKVPLKMPGSR
jgi:Rrf2 family nitric oxide-sensitive transcriptional repressor